MQILVLTKPVPDPAAGAERLGPDIRLDRAASPTVVNGNDEYALEAALQLVEAHGGEVVDPHDGPGQRHRDDAQGARDGRPPRDPRHGRRRSRAPTCPTTIRVLAAAGRGRSPSTCCSPASTPRTGPGGAVDGRRRRAAGPAAAVRGRAPSSPTRPPDASASRRLSAKGYDLIEAPMPAVDLLHPGARARRATRRSRGSWPPGPARSPPGRSRTSARAWRPADGAWATHGRRRRAAARPGRRPRDHRRRRRTPPARSPTSSPTGGSSDARP